MMKRLFATLFFIVAFAAQAGATTEPPRLRIVDADPEPVILEMAKHEKIPPTVYKGKGCDECRMSGYHGRMGLYEVLVVDDAVRRLIMEKVPAEAIKQKLLESDWKSMRQDGWQKVAMGATTPEEVLRVTLADERG